MAEPMTVTRIEGSNMASQPHPPMSFRWSELDQLRWRAGLLRFDTGVVLDIGPERDGKYLVQVEEKFRGLFSFDEMVGFIHGVQHAHRVQPG